MNEVKVGQIYKLDDLEYLKVIHIFKSRAMCIRLDYIDKSFYETQLISGGSFICNAELVDKVPSKIIEVEEEVSIYITPNVYRELQETSVIIFSYLSPFIYMFSEEEGCTERIGSINKKVKKELNFNWDTGEWE